MMQNSTNDSYFIFTTLDDFKHGLRKEFKQKSMTEDLNGKGLKRFQCGNCWKLYSTKRDLKSHIKLIHIRNEKHDCNLCSRSFYSKRDLKGHFTRIHEESNKVECSNFTNLCKI